MIPASALSRNARRVSPGSIYWASIEAHLRCRDCQAGQPWAARCPKVRPFVVYATRGALCYAAPLTTKWGWRRLAIPEGWLEGGRLAREQYLADGQATFALPAWVLVRLGPPAAVRFSAEGVAAVAAFVEQAGGLLPAGVRKGGAA